MSTSYVNTRLSFGSRVFAFDTNFDTNQI